MILWIFWIIVWMLLGILGILFVYIFECRGEEYDPEKYSCFDWTFWFALVMLGPISCVATCIIKVIITLENKFSKRFIHRLFFTIANIGVRKKKQQDGK